MSFQITIEKFQGPLHVLLGLVEKRKLHISEISLAAVADEFMAYMHTRTMDYAEVTSFLSIASTLLLIKIKSILPAVELTADESVSVDDLTERLRKYAVIQQYANKIGTVWGVSPWYERPESILYTSREPLFIPHDAVTIPNMIHILRDVIREIPVPEKREQAVITATIKIEDIIERFEKLVTSGTVSWEHTIMSKYHAAGTIAEKKLAKTEAVVSFLAMLEMFKKGVIHVIQEDNFHDIQVGAQIPAVHS